MTFWGDVREDRDKWRGGHFDAKRDNTHTELAEKWSDHQTNCNYKHSACGIFSIFESANHDLLSIFELSNRDLKKNLKLLGVLLDFMLHDFVTELCHSVCSAKKKQGHNHIMRADTMTHTNTMAVTWADTTLHRGLFSDIADGQCIFRQNFLRDSLRPLFWHHRSFWQWRQVKVSP